MSAVNPVLSSQDQYIQSPMDTTPLTSNDSKNIYKEVPCLKVVKLNVIEKHHNQAKAPSLYLVPPQFGHKTKPLVPEITKNGQKIRKDYFGTVINKKNKKNVKLVFIDEISDQPLIEDVPIESIKEFNIIPFPGGKDYYVKENLCCSCFVF